MSAIDRASYSVQLAGFSSGRVAMAVSSLKPPEPCEVHKLQGTERSSGVRTSRRNIVPIGQGFTLKAEGA